MRENERDSHGKSRAIAPARVVTISVVVTAACVVATYAFATREDVIYSDVFPVISETFITKPGSYIAEFCLSFAAWALFAVVWVVKGFLQHKASSNEAWAKHAGRTAVVGYVGATSLALTAAINYEESLAGHVVVAFTFMFAMVIWVTCVFAQTWRHPGCASARSRVVKLIALIGAWLGVTIFTALSMFVMREKAYSFIGFGEWLAVLSILLFCYTMAFDFDAEKASLVLVFDGVSAV